MPTFTDIGLDFPLFQGVVEDAILEEPGVCSRCAATAPLLLAKKCYDCFRASGHTMNTEYGMVRPEDARAGVTHGVPLDPKRLPDLPLVAHPIDPAFPDEHWYSIKCDPQDLEELTRTPKYHTWQGEQWLFCCGNRSFVLIKIYETLYFVARFCSFRHIFLWHENFTLTTCV